MPTARPFLHAIFLSRRGGEELTDTTSRRGQAAFLTLRVVDLLGQPWQEVEQVFEYQRIATTRYVAELDDQGHPETSRLRTILASCIPGNLPPLLSALRDYAAYLDIVGLPAESTDVLQTLIDLGVGQVSPGEWIEALQQAIRMLVELQQGDEATALYKRAVIALRGVTDTEVRGRARLARLELAAARGELTHLARAAHRCWMSAEQSGNPALEWNAAITLSRVFLAAGTPVDAALVLEGIRTSKRPAPSLAAELDYAEALLRLGNVGLARTALDQSLAGDIGDTLRLRAKRLALEACARGGDELGFARGMKELRSLLDSADVEGLRTLVEEATRNR